MKSIIYLSIDYYKGWARARLIFVPFQLKIPPWLGGPALLGVLTEINLHWLILKYINAFVLSQDAPQ